MEGVFYKILLELVPSEICLEMIRPIILLQKTWRYCKKKKITLDSIAWTFAGNLPFSNRSLSAANP